MAYCIKLEDSKGELESYYRCTDEDMAYQMYEMLIEKNVQEGYSVKLIDENFKVVSSYKAAKQNVVQKREAKP